MRERRRRLATVLAIVFVLLSGVSVNTLQHRASPSSTPSTVSSAVATGSAADTLQKLAVKGRAPKTGYARTQFGDGWENLGDCDVREHVLQRDLSAVKTRSATDCTVLSGTLHDPYTSKTISFTRGPGSSAAVQIDHVVALSDAWQTGAQQLSATTRAQLANDPLELLAVDGPTNQAKGDGDAATWLPPNKSYRCAYVARQIAVKQKYQLWVTLAERSAMQGVLGGCAGQALPTG